MPIRIVIQIIRTECLDWSSRCTVCGMHDRCIRQLLNDWLVWWRATERASSLSMSSHWSAPHATSFTLLTRQ